MASRVIIRRRKYLLDHINTPVRSTSTLSSFGHRSFGYESCDVDKTVVRQVPEQSLGDSDNRKERSIAITTKEDLLGFSSRGFLRSPLNRISLLGYGYGRQEYGLPLGVRYLLQSVRTATTATAGQPDVASVEEPNEDQNQKQMKEASPEECDQAVEGLSSAKAKAKAKQVQEVAQKPAQSIVQRFWARLLGIGPALRAIASMSRSYFLSF